MRRKICKEYNGGLEWVLNYYTNNDVDWKWYYVYDYGPLFKDLEYSKTNINEVEERITEDHKIPMTESAQLSYVIPDKNNTEIKKVRWAFTRYFWEAHVE
jgi:5'-3' exonuclease